MGSWTIGTRGAGGWIAAGAVAAVLLTAGCDPSSTDTAKPAAAGQPTQAATGASPTQPVNSPQPSAPAAAPTAHESSQQPTHRPTAAPTTPTEHRTTQAPEPTRPAAEPTTKAPEPTQPAAPAGSCASHTVGDCGWDLGLTPAHPGETAECADGTTSDSAHFQGTCSQHRGVRHWFK
ncbi:DUF3761 domain-containing protein [Kitasatospora kifunensis]|uniref:Type IV secretory pathway VirB10-like protein n=1 Tax=Kitasatospora kifunensis TaxID=58351 RepID=A0A7W7R025_KITKI|nr:DUF3761 domain-containing protein [Kitasatospora kifunensis]MBB4922986.1 type IV secretory pathway VirB10-like protein [Kitasatospora kifunensis]